jgi:Tn3 transposase DDE domain
LTRRLQCDLITGCWDDLLRVAASVHGGHATAVDIEADLAGLDADGYRPLRLAAAGSER